VINCIAYKVTTKHRHSDSVARNLVTTWGG